MPGSKFANDCLSAHNEKRKLHGVPKLKLNSELCLLAENWALHLIRTGELKHSNNQYKGNPLGENIAAKSSTGTVNEYTGSEVVEQWYSEVKEYDFKSPGSTGLSTGHFSQVVWKDSQELGVGVATQGSRCIVVANYSPAGNVIGRHKENVFPAGSKSSVFKNLLGKGKKGGDDDSSSSSSDDERAASKKVTTKPVSGGSRGTSKVTVTKTIRKPDGTVETVVEERVEEITGDMATASFKGASAGSSSAGGKPTKSQSTGEFRQDALDTHNKYRAIHSAPKLKLNTELCNVAQKWAENLATISSLKHSSNQMKGEPLGENIASKWGSNGADYTGAEVTEQWYSEEPAYDYSGKSNAGKAGHFSQVVWKASAELGIGKAKDSKGRVYVVANYKPAGNFIGQFAQNVSKKK